MKETDSLTRPDLEQLSELGISASEAQRQMDLLRQPPRPVQLVRPCRPADGIVRIPDDQQAGYVERWRSLARDHRLAKFVPASGAATRMFKDLTAPTAPVESAHPAGARQLLESLPQFAFSEALQRSLKGDGLALESLVERHEVEPILRALLGSAGLDYGNAPKGLILFHGYPAGPRSALEDQLWEGCGYLTPSGGTCRFHFTVTGAHENAFQEQIVRYRDAIESRLDVTLEIGFSTQNPDTDTVAMDSDNHPVRRTDGRLLLRPAGHGALLKNLQAVDADLVFIKNIDNVAHQRLHPVSIHWKRVLAGHFAEIQEQIFAILSALDRQPNATEPVDQALQLLRDSLAVEVPAVILDSTPLKRRQYVLDRLDRPLRICGMVRNEGEPGGGPFWLPDNTGGATGQIVEVAQVDFTSPDQVAIWNSSTHFNPVDLICGLRNRHGQPYRLQDFIDPGTSFVAEKSHAGRPIKALERPGLWNGSMAHWNTAFVEVPLQTFTPVKTVFDLLRPEHQL